jgi:hypothetical protein
MSHRIVRLVVYDDVASWTADQEGKLNGVTLDIQFFVELEIPVLRWRSSRLANSPAWHHSLDPARHTGPIRPSGGHARISYSSLNPPAVPGHSHPTAWNSISPAEYCTYWGRHSKFLTVVNCSHQAMTWMCIKQRRSVEAVLIEAMRIASS